MELTQERLKEILEYDEETGFFHWKKRIAHCVHIGDVAGKVDRYGYVTIGLYVKEYRAHRLAFLYITGEWPKNNVDHINGIRDDNRWENLRDVSSVHNMRNQKKSIRNKTGIVGVSQKHNGFVARIGNIKLYKGSDFFEACCARKSAEKACGFHDNHGRAA